MLPIQHGEQLAQRLTCRFLPPAKGRN